MQTATLPGFAGYLNAQSTAAAARRAGVTLPALTLSRECGAQALTIAKILADDLNSREERNGAPPWTIFDRELVERVMAEHKLPRLAARYMPEDLMPQLRTAFEELLGLHPSRIALLQFTNETILHLARAGHSIIVGRGGSIVTANLPNVLHVRLIAPLEGRVREIAAQLNLTSAEAREHVEKTDRARRRYLRQSFSAPIDDPLAYHLTINTGIVPSKEAAAVIAEAVKRLGERLDGR